MCLIAALPLLALSACGSDPEPAEAETATPAAVDGDPLSQIPPEELYGASPVENLWSPRVELEVLNIAGGWQGAEIAILSDFQLGRWPANEEIAVEAVRKAVGEDPDLIVLIGDFIGEGSDTGALDRALAPLQGRPALAVLGESDVRTDSLATRVVASLSNAGIQVLRNTASGVVINGDTAWIGGLDPDLVSMTGADQQYVVNTLGVPGRTPILLTAVPSLATRVQDDRFPIVVSGGAFCGDVDVPGATRLASLRENTFPGSVVEGVDRLFQMEGTTVLISCGLGWSFVPLQFGAAPEVPILTISGGPRAAAADTATAAADRIYEELQEPAADSL